MLALIKDTNMKVCVHICVVTWIVNQRDVSTHEYNDLHALAHKLQLWEGAFALMLFLNVQHDTVPM